MFKHKRVLTSVVAMLLCMLTLFSSAFALTVQNATRGTPARPSTVGGGEGNPSTTYNSTIITGYRFTCWRSTDRQVAQANGTTGSALTKYTTMHYQNGYKLGHSINIIVNTTSCWDYSGGYGQTGKKAPRIFSNAEGTDLLDKISVAQTEIADEESGKYTAEKPKVTHATKSQYVTIHYNGDENGRNMNGGSTFTFTAPLYTKVEEKIDAEDKGQSLLGGKTASADRDHPVTIHSGYFTRDNKAEDYINPNASRREEQNNLYTYVYGIEHHDAYGTDPAGYNRNAPGILSIADVDHPDSPAFNQEPYNIIGMENSWTDLNASLIATLCGLNVTYGEQTDLDTNFGMYDYIIVEPLYSVYYYFQRFF